MLALGAICGISANLEPVQSAPRKGINIYPVVFHYDYPKNDLLWKVMLMGRIYGPVFPNPMMCERLLQEMDLEEQRTHREKVLGPVALDKMNEMLGKINQRLL